MIVIVQFEVDDEQVFRPQLDTALTTLAARPGYLGGHGARSVDDPRAWVLVLEWASVGDYRRALGSYDVKLHATPLLAQALDRPSAFESLTGVDAQGTVTRSVSDRSPLQSRPWAAALDAAELADPAGGQVPDPRPPVSRPPEAVSPTPPGQA